MEDVGIVYGHLVFLRPFDTLNGRLVYFVAIRYIFPRYGICMYCTKQNLATLV
jgi:hypothetical protein